MLWRLFHTSKLDQYRHNDNTWAVVTGSSDGIGKSTAEELLKSGFNVVVHGRNESKLAKVVQSFRMTYPEREVASVIADLNVVSDVQKIVDVLQGKHITIFFNNAAATGQGFALFDSYTDEQIDGVLNVGVISVTKLVRQVLPILIANAPATLVNVGSAAGVNPVPYISAYAASKGYLLALTKSLALEARITKSRVDIMYYDVHTVNSGTNSIKPNLAAPTSPVMARAMLYVLGCGKTFVTPYWVHELSNYVVALLPGPLYDRVVLQSIIAVMESGDPSRYQQVTDAKAKGRWQD